MLARQYLAYGLLVLLVTVAAATLVLAAGPAWAVWIVAIVATVVSIAVLDDFRRRRERVMRHAAEALRRLAAGKFGHKLYAGGSPALSELAQATNAAVENLA